MEWAVVLVAVLAAVGGKEHHGHRRYSEIEAEDEGVFRQHRPIEKKTLYHRQRRPNEPSKDYSQNYNFGSQARPRGFEAGTGRWPKKDTTVKDVQNLKYPNIYDPVKVSEDPVDLSYPSHRNDAEGLWSGQDFARPLKPADFPDEREGEWKEHKVHSKKVEKWREEAPLQYPQPLVPQLFVAHSSYEAAPQEDTLQHRQPSQLTHYEELKNEPPQSFHRQEPIQSSPRPKPFLRSDPPKPFPRQQPSQSFARPEPSKSFPRQESVQNFAEPEPQFFSSNDWAPSHKYVASFIKNDATTQSQEPLLQEPAPEKSSDGGSKGLEHTYYFPVYADQREKKSEGQSGGGSQGRKKISARYKAHPTTTSNRVFDLEYELEEGRKKLNSGREKYVSTYRGESPYTTASKQKEEESLEYDPPVGPDSVMPFESVKYRSKKVDHGKRVPFKYPHDQEYREQSPRQELPKPIFPVKPRPFQPSQESDHQFRSPSKFANAGHQQSPTSYSAQQQSHNFHPAQQQSQNSFPSIPQTKTSSPSQQSQNTFPSQQSQATFPSQQSQTAFPSQQSQTPFPLQQSQTTFPSQQSHSAYPVQPKSQTAFPSEQSQTAFPSQPQSKTAFPLQPQSQTSFPGQQSQTLYPSKQQSQPSYSAQQHSQTSYSPQKFLNSYPTQPRPQKSYSPQQQSQSSFPTQQPPQTFYSSQQQSQTSFPEQQQSQTSYPSQHTLETSYPAQTQSQTSYPVQQETRQYPTQQHNEVSYTAQQQFKPLFSSQQQQPPQSGFSAQKPSSTQANYQRPSVELPYSVQEDTASSHPVDSQTRGTYREESEGWSGGETKPKKKNGRPARMRRPAKHRHHSQPQSQDFPSQESKSYHKLHYSQHIEPEEVKFMDISKEQMKDTSGNIMTKPTEDGQVVQYSFHVSHDR